jgi:hypothetical protein
MNLEELAIGGIALAYLIPGLLEFLKKLGLAGERNIVIAGATLGFIFTSLAAALQQNLIPDVALPWVKVVAYGLAGIIEKGIYMNPREAAEYLKRQHELEVTPSTIARWIKAGHVEGCKLNGRWTLTDECLDRAVEAHNIPRRAGRKATLSKEQRETIRDLYDHKGWSQKKLANRFQVSVSYISLIVRNLR